MENRKKCEFSCLLECWCHFHILCPTSRLNVNTLKKPDGNLTLWWYSDTLQLWPGNGRLQHRQKVTAPAASHLIGHWVVMFTFLEFEKKKKNLPKSCRGGVKGHTVECQYFWYAISICTVSRLKEMHSVLSVFFNLFPFVTFFLCFLFFFSILDVTFALPFRFFFLPGECQLNSSPRNYISPIYYPHFVWIQALVTFCSLWMRRSLARDK